MENLFKIEKFRTRFSPLFLRWVFAMFCWKFERGAKIILPFAWKKAPHSKNRQISQSGWNGRNELGNECNGEYSGQKCLFIAQPGNLLNFISALFFGAFFYVSWSYRVKIDISSLISLYKVRSTKIFFTFLSKMGKNWWKWKIFLKFLSKRSFLPCFSNFWKK